mgnify:FL=1
MERYEIVVDDEGNYCGLIPSENGSVVKYADAQATVEALQRERDEANLYRDQARANQESLAACVDRDVRKIKDLQAALDAEREKVKGLHEITKVICAHCCEPMEIPSKAVLQTQLTQLKALVRDFIEAWDHDGEPNAVAYEGVVERARATLDATTPATKGGDGE